MLEVWMKKGVIHMWMVGVWGYAQCANRLSTNYPHEKSSKNAEMRLMFGGGVLILDMTEPWLRVGLGMGGGELT